MITSTILHIFEILTRLPRAMIRRTKSALFRVMTCVLLVALLLALACAGLFFLVHSAIAEDADIAEPLAVQLLIDNSNSLFEMGGVGSDPDLLRIDAARLFISYLGVDDGQAIHRCGVIYFGDTARVVVPLTDLTDATRRQEMFSLLADPPRMGWTDQAEALTLARQELSAASGRPAVIMFTDGKPEWDETPTTAERETVVARLRAESEALRQANIPLFIVLLANEATDADPEIADFWRPLWEELTGATRPGRFYVVRQPDDLPSIYHDIVLTLTGGRTDGAVLAAEVGPEGIRESVSVEPNLARLTLVVSKSAPELIVTILYPDGTPLSEGATGVRHAGTAGVTREEVWVVDEPSAGEWTVLISGEGRVTVWKDYRPQPTPTPTLTPSATSSPTATPLPSPTATPPALLHVEGVPSASLAGETITVSAWLENPPADQVSIMLFIEQAGDSIQSLELLDDGRQGDERQGDDRYGAGFTVERAGEYLVRVQVGEGVAAWSARLSVESHPTLALLPVTGRPRAGDMLDVVARWEIGGQPLPEGDAIRSRSAEARIQGETGSVTRLPLKPQPDGTLAGVLPLTAAGALTITVRATALTGRGQSLDETAAPVYVVVRGPYPYWAWVGLLIALTGAAGGLFYRRQQARRPRVQGDLLVVEGAGFAGGEVKVELDSLHASQISVGAYPADIVIDGVSDRFTILVDRTLNGSRQVLIEGSNGVLHNGRRLQGRESLFDRSTIELNGTKLRYENLILESAQRSEDWFESSVVVSGV